MQTESTQAHRSHGRRHYPDSNPSGASTLHPHSPRLAFCAVNGTNNQSVRMIWTDALLVCFSDPDIPHASRPRQYGVLCAARCSSSAQISLGKTTSTGRGRAGHGSTVKGGSGAAGTRPGRRGRAISVTSPDDLLHSVCGAPAPVPNLAAAARNGNDARLSCLTGNTKRHGPRDDARPGVARRALEKRPARGTPAGRPASVSRPGRAAIPTATELPAVSRPLLPGRIERQPGRRARAR